MIEDTRTLPLKYLSEHIIFMKHVLNVLKKGEFAARNKYSL